MNLMKYCNCCLWKEKQAQILNSNSDDRQEKIQKEEDTEEVETKIEKEVIINQNKLDVEEPDKDKKKYENQNTKIILEKKDRPKSFQDCDLKCDQCNNPFDLYCEPKLLPCNNTICNDCESKIVEKSINNQFKCEICLIYHTILANVKFPINKEKHAKIIAEPIEIPKKSEEYKQLEINFNNIKFLLKKLENFEIISIEILYEHCSEQKRLVQFETESKIQNLKDSEDKIDHFNQSNEKLIEVIDNYENKCKQNFLVSNKSNSIKESISKLIEDTNNFLNVNFYFLVIIFCNKLNLGI